jgi:hypothetical protein
VLTLRYLCRGVTLGHRYRLLHPIALQHRSAALWRATYEGQPQRDVAIFISDPRRDWARRIRVAESCDDDRTGLRVMIPVDLAHSDVTPSEWFARATEPAPLAWLRKSFERATTSTALGLAVGLAVCVVLAAALAGRPAIPGAAALAVLIYAAAQCGTWLCWPLIREPQANDGGQRERSELGTHRKQREYPPS